MDLLNWKDFGFKMVLPMKQLSQNMGIKDCEIIIISQTYYVIFY